MIKLHYAPGRASLAPHCLLNAMNLKFEAILIDLGNKQNYDEKYLCINPNGTVPTLEHDQLVLTESAAICLYLSQLQKRSVWYLSPGEQAYFKMANWLFYLSNTLQAELMIYHYPNRVIDKNNLEASAIKLNAERRINKIFIYIDGTLSSENYLLDDKIAACDIFLFMLCRWARFFNYPPSKLPRLGKLLNNVVQRPATQKTLRVEGITEPYI